MKKTVKYGSLSAVFVAVVLAAVVLLNLFITLIESKVSLTVDLTDKGVYSVSAAAKEFIKGIDTPITIYFCKNRDLLEGDPYTLMVRNLIEEFDKEYDNIHIKYIDIDRDKALADKWNKESGTTVTPSSIIVSSDITGQFRHLYPAGFFATAQSTGKLYAFKGEITLTNAIIQVSGEERPVIAFTTGHSEDINNTALKNT